jgi:single-strand DNA-binding protein
MRNLSFAIVDGNLTHDPELVSTRTGKVVATFSIACNHDERFTTKENVSYFIIECWDRVAENCATYLKKGSKVTVQGSLRQDRWKDAEGKTRSKVKIVAQNVRFDSVKRQQEDQSSSSNIDYSVWNDPDDIPF